MLSRWLIRGEPRYRTFFILFTVYAWSWWSCKCNQSLGTESRTSKLQAIYYSRTSIFWCFWSPSNIIYYDAIRGVKDELLPRLWLHEIGQLQGGGRNRIWFTNTKKSPSPPHFPISIESRLPHCDSYYSISDACHFLKPKQVFRVVYCKYNFTKLYEDTQCIAFSELK